MSPSPNMSPSMYPNMSPSMSPSMSPHSRCKMGESDHLERRMHSLRNRQTCKTGERLRCKPGLLQGRRMPSLQERRIHSRHLKIENTCRRQTRGIRAKSRRDKYSPLLRKLLRFDMVNTTAVGQCRCWRCWCRTCPESRSSASCGSSESSAYSPASRCQRAPRPPPPRLFPSLPPRASLPPPPSLS